jgi:hypothetical protein
MPVRVRTGIINPVFFLDRPEVDFFHLDQGIDVFDFTQRLNLLSLTPLPLLPFFLSFSRVFLKLKGFFYSITLQLP